MIKALNYVYNVGVLNQNVFCYFTDSSSFGNTYIFNNAETHGAETTSTESHRLNV
jgi:hypothetical protein